MFFKKKKKETKEEIGTSEMAFGLWESHMHLARRVNKIFTWLWLKRRERENLLISPHFLLATWSIEGVGGRWQMDPSAAGLCVVVAFVFPPKDAPGSHSWKLSAASCPLPSSLPPKVFTVPSNKRPHTAFLNICWKTWIWVRGQHPGAQKVILRRHKGDR